MVHGLLMNFVLPSILDSEQIQCFKLAPSGLTIASWINLMCLGKQNRAVLKETNCASWVCEIQMFPLLKRILISTLPEKKDLMDLGIENTPLPIKNSSEGQRWGCSKGWFYQKLSCLLLPLPRFPPEFSQFLQQGTSPECWTLLFLHLHCHCYPSL